MLSILAAVAGYYVGGSGEGGRTLAAMANTPNVSLALGIVTSVDAPPVFAVTIAGTFLLRLIMGAFVKRIVARRGPDLEPTCQTGSCHEGHQGREKDTRATNGLVTPPRLRRQGERERHGWGLDLAALPAC